MRKIAFISLLAMVTLLFVSCISKDIRINNAIVYNAKSYYIIAIDGIPVKTNYNYYALTPGTHTLTIRQKTQNSIVGKIVENALIQEAKVKFHFAAGKKYTITRKGFGVGKPTYVIAEYML